MSLHSILKVYHNDLSCTLRVIIFYKNAILKWLTDASQAFRTLRRTLNPSTKRVNSYCVVRPWNRNQVCFSSIKQTWTTYWSFFRSLNIHLPYDSVIPLLGACPRETNTYEHKNTWTRMFITALFQNLGTTQVPSTRQWRINF